MQERLGELGISYHKFDAINGKQCWEDLVPSIDIEAFEKNVGRKVMPGEIGCYHSHLKVWEQLIETGARVGLILEDDVVFHPNFRSAVDLALEHKEAWDILKLNYIRAKFPAKKARIGEMYIQSYIGPFTGMGAYLIHAETAARILPQMLPITRPIDHEIDRPKFHEIRHLALTPFPSHVSDNNDSTITGQSFGNVEKFPPWRRLRTYSLRWKNLIDKARYLSK
ncbi:glycosyl transferase family 25 [Yoonia maritima]|uniref:Glycosyl transferase family 25 n=2 Tax=Yoonia maritima TaxID=1435347 RepID=A0A2T0W3A4_9RHOB|nr:glycosyl transferase family 25 [Yoonia maritima]